MGRKEWEEWKGGKNRETEREKQEMTPLSSFCHLLVSSGCCRGILFKANMYLTLTCKFQYFLAQRLPDSKFWYRPPASLTLMLWILLSLWNSPPPPTHTHQKTRIHFPQNGGKLGSFSYICASFPFGGSYVNPITACVLLAGSLQS